MKRAFIAAIIVAWALGGCRDTAFVLVVGVSEEDRAALAEGEELRWFAQRDGVGGPERFGEQTALVRVSSDGDASRPAPPFRIVYLPSDEPAPTELVVELAAEDGRRVGALSENLLGRGIPVRIEEGDIVERFAELRPACTMSCPSGQVCVADVCVSPCDDEFCVPGAERCEDVDGGRACRTICPSDPMGVCAPNELCDAVRGCEEACGTVVCAGDQTCDDGRCVTRCGAATCSAGQVCSDGACVCSSCDCTVAPTAVPESERIYREEALSGGDSTPVLEITGGSAGEPIVLDRLTIQHRNRTGLRIVNASDVTITNLDVIRLIEDDPCPDALERQRVGIMAECLSDGGEDCPDNLHPDTKATVFVAEAACADQAPVANVIIENSTNVTIQNARVSGGSVGFLVLDSEGVRIEQAEGSGFRSLATDAARPDVASLPGVGRGECSGSLETLEASLGGFVRVWGGNDFTLRNFATINPQSTTYVDFVVSLYGVPDFDISGGYIEGANGPHGIGVHVDEPACGSGRFAVAPRDRTARIADIDIVRTNGPCISLWRTYGIELEDIDCASMTCDPLGYREPSTSSRLPMSASGFPGRPSYFIGNGLRVFDNLECSSFYEDESVEIRDATAPTEIRDCPGVPKCPLVDTTFIAESLGSRPAAERRASTVVDLASLCLASPM